MKLIAIQINEDKTKAIFSTIDCQSLLDAYENYYPIIGFHLPWVGYFIFKEDKIVGSCGFTGKPISNQVEIAYWTFKEYENQGIASFACQELIKIAKKEKDNLKIVAKTAPEHNASTKILEKNNFIYSKVVQDEEIGDAWLWKLKS